MLAGEVTAEVPVPAVVLLLAGADPITPVWRNERDGLTFQLGHGRPRRFVKWSPPGGIDLTREAEKLRWAASRHFSTAQYVPVPEVLDLGTDNDGSWLMTAGLPGHNAVAPRWKADPARAVAAIGRGLRQLHDAAPAADFPFSWSQPDRLAEIRQRATRIDPGQWHTSHQRLTVPQALERLADPPPIDRLVVCHGDACAPNTLIADDGTCSGQVDLGALGVADRWADLAIATWSTQWNYGPGWELQLLEAYGVEPDPERTDYYRLLWDLGP